jgi:hypothetical protein
MEAIISGLLLLSLLWLTILTHKNRKQTAKNKKLKNELEYYKDVILRINPNSNGKEKNEKGQTKRPGETERPES